MASKRLGEILVELGYVALESVHQAMREVNGDGLRIGEHLCRLGLVRHEEVTHALALQCGVPIIEPAGAQIAPEALQCCPAELAERYRVLPVALQDGVLDLAMEDPFDLQVVDDLSVVTGREIRRLYARPSELSEARRHHYGTSAARMADSLATQIDTPDLAEADDGVGHLHELAREPSLINLVNLIILEAVQDKASDIHIEPFERRLKVKYRIDGVLHEMAPPPKHLQAAIVSRIKIMAQLNIAERFVPQDGHIKFAAPNVQVDIRVSTVPTMYGESVVLRILDKSSTLRQLGELGMGEELLRRFESTLKKPHGILLVTGPTGSGKTTTLYAALNHIYTPGKMIITIEDPVEFHLEGVNQMQVNPKRGLTFANGLRAILRQDPDIIMVGEVRDAETADIAIRSALTGHLVFSSLHTNDAPSAITRLLDMKIEPFLLATTVEGVVAQRLVRVICERCIEEYEPTAQSLAPLGRDAELFRGARLKRGRGCHDCHNTGFRGRLGIFEMLRVKDPVREVIMTRPSSSQVRKAAGVELGSMRQDGYAKVLAGTTTLEEVWRVTQDVSTENGTTEDSFAYSAAACVPASGWAGHKRLPPQAEPADAALDERVLRAEQSMPVFQYRAMTAGGGEVAGELDAADRPAAIRELANRGACVTEIRPRHDGVLVGLSHEAGRSRIRLRPKQLAVLTRQLAVSLEAGLPLMTALDVMGRELDHAPSRNLLTELGTRVQQGVSLSDAMAEHPAVFPPMYIRLVRVGETGGVLDTILTQLAGMLERQTELKERVKTASIYPSLVLLLGVASVIIIVTFIVPRIVGSIGAGSLMLPWPTRVLMAASAVFQRGWWLLLSLVVAIGFAWRQFVLRGPLRGRWDAFKLRVPILGRLIRQLEAARFARSLGILARGGVAITEAMAVVRDTIQNSTIRQAVSELAQSIQSGEAISRPLQRCGLFPPLLVQMVRVGESTGRLDEMLLRSADVHESEAKVTLDRLVNVLPVLMILALACVIGFIVAGLVLAIVELQTAGV